LWTHKEALLPLEEGKTTVDAQGFAAGPIIPENLQNDSIFGFLADICSPALFGLFKIGSRETRPR